MPKILILCLILVSLFAASLLTSCSEPAYVPDDATLAEREAQEYQTAIDRGQWAWRIGLAATVGMLAILCGLVFFLAQVRYRVAAAGAAKAEIEVRRLHLVPMGNDMIYDLKTNTIHKANYPALSRIAPIVPISSLPTPQNNGNPYSEFVRRAAQVAPDRWRSKTIPRFDRFNPPMRAGDWQEITDRLVDEELINPKEQGKETTIAGGQDLGGLYNTLTTSPIEY